VDQARAGPAERRRAPNQNFAVRWEVSADEGFTRIVQSETETATPGYGHSVHVEVEGLGPARYY